MSTDPRRLPGQLQALVYRAKDEVVRQQAETHAVYLELYDRIGALPQLFLGDPDRARAEIIELCDIEAGLTGDCKATSDIAELLDPDGEHFHEMAEARYTIGVAPEPRSLEFVTEALRLTDDEVGVLSRLKVTEGIVLAGQNNPHSVVRVS